MRVYEATVIDKCASPSGEEPVSFESYIVVDDENDGTKAWDWKKLAEDLKRETGFRDELIHYYFTKDEWEDNLHDGEIETEEFKYLIGKRVA